MQYTGCIGFFVILLAILLFLKMNDSTKNYEKIHVSNKNYKIEVVYKNGDKDTLSGTIKKFDDYYQIEDMIDIDRDFGSECLYVKEDMSWKKMCCGVRKYKIIK